MNNKLNEDIENVLNNINERKPVLLRSNTPKILVENGVKNLPMYDNPSHIRKNILTINEVQKLVLRISLRDHYHRFIKINKNSYNYLGGCMRLSDLQRKDIVNVNDGRIIGRIIDAEINDKSGGLESLIIEKSKYIRNLFSSENDITIKFEQIKKLGSDVILIEL